MTATIDLIALPHVPRKLLELIEEGQTVPSYRDQWLRACNGELPMIVFDNGRWKCPEPEFPALAEALGLRLKPSSLLPPAAKKAKPAKPKPATSKPPRPRVSRSAASAA
jgi:hypothetical protein